MTNWNTVLIVTSLLLALFGLSVTYDAITGFSKTAGMENTIPSSNDYFMMGFGGIFILLASFCISPLYDRIHNGILVTKNVRIAIVVIFLAIGLYLIWIASLSSAILY